MIIDRRTLLASAAALPMAAAPRVWAQAQPIFTPEAFGAVGNGMANDTDAFAAMASAVCTAGGGTIVLRARTYRVGRQLQGQAARSGYTFEPLPIMDFVGLRGGLIIQGNGARLKAAPGLRYGTFAVGGRATRHTMPFVEPGELAAPYRFMIRVEDCAGPVEICDIELDGGLPSLIIGGQFGDTGWQLPGSGLGLINNRGPERVSRIVSHHHPQDGVIIDGVDSDRRGAVGSLMSDMRCEHNGRQGLSLVGGRGYTFQNCVFSGTGKAGLASAPGAGVDIEAEQGKRIRDIRFAACEFLNNHGPGLVADSGDSERISFEDCTFVGTSNWAAWPNKPLMRFTRCTFAGAITRAHGDREAQRATQFVDCTFRDDPALSPTHALYGGVNQDRPVADLPYSENTAFRKCRFLLTHDAVLPWSAANVIYEDCTMSQRANAESYPRGIFRGRNTIDGRSNLYGSVNQGTLTHNGRPMPRGTIL